MQLRRKHFGTAKLSTDEQLLFLDYFQQVLKNGYSLKQGLQLLPIIWPQQAQRVQKLQTALQTGTSLGQCLKKMGFAQAVAAQLDLAWQEGKMADCLAQLSELMRLKNKQLKKVRAELAYPVVLIIMMVMLLIFMQSFVQSQFQTQDWTGTALILLMVVVGLILLGAAAYGAVLFRRQDYRALHKLSGFPIVGSTVRLYVHYLLIYDLSLLLGNGFSIRQICQLASKQAPGSLQAVLGQRLLKQFEAGKDLAEMIKDEPALPSNLQLLLAGGSDKKALAKRCRTLGQTIFYELTRKLNRLIVSLQPICFILIGLAIVGMYLKLLMPMYDLMQQL